MKRGFLQNKTDIGNEWVNEKEPFYTNKKKIVGDGVNERK